MIRSLASAALPVVFLTKAEDDNDPVANPAKTALSIRIVSAATL